MTARVRFWGWLSGVALTRCARAATKAGDTHEASHCIAALRVGESNHERGDCRVLTVRRPHIWAWAHGDFHAIDGHEHNAAVARQKEGRADA